MPPNTSTSTNPSRLSSSGRNSAWSPTGSVVQSHDERMDRGGGDKSTRLAASPTRASAPRPGRGGAGGPGSVLAGGAVRAGPCPYTATGSRPVPDGVRGAAVLGRSAGVGEARYTQFRGCPHWRQGGSALRTGTRAPPSSATYGARPDPAPPVSWAHRANDLTRTAPVPYGDRQPSPDGTVNVPTVLSTLSLSIR